MASEKGHNLTEQAMLDMIACLWVSESDEQVATAINKFMDVYGSDLQPPIEPEHG